MIWKHLTILCLSNFSAKLFAYVIFYLYLAFQINIMDSLEKDLRHELSVRNTKVRRYKNAEIKTSQKPLMLIIENLFSQADNIKNYTTPKQLFYLNEFWECFEKYKTLTERQIEVLKDIITKCKERKNWNQTT